MWPLGVESCYGPASRTRPHDSRSRWIPRCCGCSSLFRRETSFSPRAPTRRHRLSRRTHYFLLPDRHLPASQRRPLSPLLALWKSPKVTRSFSFTSLYLRNFLCPISQFELRANKHPIFLRRGNQSGSSGVFEPTPREFRLQTRQPQSASHLR